MIDTSIKVTHILMLIILRSYISKKLFIRTKNRPLVCISWIDKTEDTGHLGWCWKDREPLGQMWLMGTSYGERVVLRSNSALVFFGNIIWKKIWVFIELWMWIKLLKKDLDRSKCRKSQVDGIKQRHLIDKWTLWTWRVHLRKWISIHLRKLTLFTSILWKKLIIR